MQSFPSVSVDTMFVGPSTGKSSPGAEQNTIFAAHLANASQEQQTTTHHTETLNVAKDDTSLTKNSNISDEPVEQDSSAEDPMLDTTIYGSMNVASQDTVPLQLQNAEAGFTFNPKKGMSKNESAVSRLLNTMTLAAGKTAERHQVSDLSVHKIPTTAATQPETTVQDFTLENGQPRISTTSPSPEIAQATPQLNSSSGVEIGSISIDNTAVQQQITVPLVTDSARKADSMTATLSITIPSEQTELAAAPQPTSGQIESTATQKGGQQNTAQQGNDQIIQDEYGQIITIHQSSEPEETATTTPAGSNGITPTELGDQRQDINNNYIHSRLPKETPSTIAEKGGGQQKDSTQDNQQQSDNSPKTSVNEQPRQVAPQIPGPLAGQESQPLIFAQQQTNTPLSVSTIDSSTMRLPSGLAVPEGTIVDQMIAHFSVNKQRESGSINLKLYPQELGELRMAIKVEQDNIKAHIIAQNPQAQEMIDRHLPRLREALEQQGLHLQHIEVTVADNDNTGGERFQGNTDRHQWNRSVRNKSSQTIFSLPIDEETGESVQASNNLSVLA